MGELRRFDGILELDSGLIRSKRRRLGHGGLPSSAAMRIADWLAVLGLRTCAALRPRRSAQLSLTKRKVDCVARSPGESAVLKRPQKPDPERFVLVLPMSPPRTSRSPLAVMPVAVTTGPGDDPPRGRRGGRWCRRRPDTRKETRCGRGSAPGTLRRVHRDAHGSSTLWTSIPVSTPVAATRSSTDRVDTPLTG